MMQRTSERTSFLSAGTAVTSTAMLLAIAAFVAPGQTGEKPMPAYQPVSPTYVSGFDEPLIDLRFELPHGGSFEVVTVRLMQRDGEIVQSFLVPGAHPYVSEGCLLDRVEGGWKGRILLSTDTRGGPARGMGTPRASHTLEVDLRVRGDDPVVECRENGKRVPASARLVAWKQIAASNDPLDPDKTWPTWHGPSCNFAAQPAGHRLVDRLNEARLVWKSQERFGSAKAQSPRYGVIAEDSGRLPLLPGAGGASPVVAAGNVYVLYYQPSGDAADEQLLAQRREKAGDKPLPRWETDLWQIAADDMIACLDGRTGQTKWRTVYKGAGANWHDSKAGPCNATPCIWGEKIFAIGSTGRVYCLNMHTGREIWQASIGRRHFAIAEAKRQALQERRFGKLKFNRDFGGAPVAVDGVVVMPDFTSHGACGLLALEAETGRRLWHIPNAVAEDSTPLIYRNRDRAYVIAGAPATSGDQGSGRIVCVEPRSGKICWTIAEGIRGNQTTMGIWKDYLLVHAPGEGRPPVEGKREPLTMKCFRITPHEAAPLWTLPLVNGIWSEHVPAIADGYVYARLIGPELLCIDIATGKIAGRAAHDLGSVGATMVFADGRLIVDRDGSHSATQLAYFETTPARDVFRPLGEIWSPPHAHGTSYHPQHAHPCVDGRLFIRGADGVYCYDLRKHEK